MESIYPAVKGVYPRHLMEFNPRQSRESIPDTLWNPSSKVKGVHLGKLRESLLGSSEGPASAVKGIHPRKLRESILGSGNPSSQLRNFILDT
jgi:hypothetical protein